MNKILITSDLDRTILPNGAQTESREARPRLRTLAAHAETIVVYVSGRNIDLLQQAISEYDLPIPDFAVGDVGTTIYRVGPTEAWEPMQEWQQVIAPDWQGKRWADVKALFNDLPDIRLQDDNPAFQNAFKVSYYTDAAVNRKTLITALESKARAANLKAAFIWSIDEERDVGLLDVLPLSATKLHAIQWLRTYLEFSQERTVFAGDSGNDMPALTSGLNAVLVKNARQDVKDEALARTHELGIADHLYIVQGGFLGMNGNYSAGVLEGIAHYFPETQAWFE